MNKTAFTDMWDARVKETATLMQKGSGAGAVMVAIFDGPWMDGEDPAIIGIAGGGKADPFRIARDLRDAADALERSAGNIARREPFTSEAERTKPVRE